MALVERHGIGILADVNVPLTHSQMPDLPILGAGGEAATDWHRPRVRVQRRLSAVGLLTLSDTSPVLDAERRYCGQYAGDMTLTADPPGYGGGPGVLRELPRSQDHQGVGPG